MLGIHQTKLKVHTTEMRMLVSTAGVTLLGRMRYVHIHGSYKVAPFADRIKERRLRWYEHRLRQPKDHMVRVALNLPSLALAWLASVQKDLKYFKMGGIIAYSR